MQLPEDDEILNAIRFEDYVMLRSAQGARLEARAAVMQPIS